MSTFNLEQSIRKIIYIKTITVMTIKAKTATNNDTIHVFIYL